MTQLSLKLCQQAVLSVALAATLVVATTQAGYSAQQVSCNDTYGWQEAQDHKTPGFQKFLFKLRSSQLVFVAGFMNEIFPTYYKDNILGIRELFKIGEEQTHIVAPSSRISVESNATWLRTEILAIHRENPAPIILVAHSKGAAESIAMLMAYPELVETGVVRDLISIQGAIFGSPLADLYSTVPEYAPSRSQGFVEWLWETVGYRARIFDNWLTEKIFAEGINSLETKPSRNRFYHLLSRLNPEYRANLNERIHYVISHVKPQDASIITRLPGLYLGGIGMNDGVIMLDDQHSEELGQVLGHYYADHTDLVMGRPASNLSKECIANFTADLLYRLSQH